MTHNDFQHYIRNKGTLILDGGLATELEKGGYQLNTSLWSASALIEIPEAVTRVHLDYLRSGSDCITTASYQATPGGFRRFGLSADEAETILRRSVTIAKDARSRYMDEAMEGENKPLIAASIGSYGAFLADGSEYRGNYQMIRSDLRSFHKERWAILKDESPDLLACETIPDSLEAEVLADLFKESHDITGWISFTAKDFRHISDGTPIRDVLKILESVRNITAVGFNCIPPSLVLPLIEQVKAFGWDREIIVYPNSGEHYNADTKSWTGEKSVIDFGDQAVEWYRAGARLIGGCCRTGPNHIRAIRRKLLRAG